MAMLVTLITPAGRVLMNPTNVIVSIDQTGRNTRRADYFRCHTALASQSQPTHTLNRYNNGSTFKQHPRQNTSSQMGNPSAADPQNRSAEPRNRQHWEL